MKEINLTFIELEKWIKENREELIGSKIKKIKQRENIFDFELFKGKNFHLIVLLPYFCFIRKSGIRIEKPTNFSMQLRKILENEVIKDVFQKEFERILIFQTNNYKIIFEFFSEGNIIVEKDKIVTALIQREWKDRSIIIGKEYKFPPSKNLIKLSFVDLINSIKEDKNLAAFLASDFGLSSYYANLILSETKIENKKAKELTQKELDTILRKIEEIRNSKNYSVITNSTIIIDSYKRKQFEKINEAFNFAFEVYTKRISKKKQEELQKKLEKIIEEKEKRQKELEEKLKELSKKIEILENSREAINNAINRIYELINAKIDWKFIKEIIKSEFYFIKEINEKKGTIILNLENIEIPFIKPLKNFLESLYEERKRIKQKLEKAEKVEIKVEEEKPKEKAEKEEKKWFEKFRWFISSDGYLVLAGKDAETNELLIKKYARDYDYVLHVDIHGSPFVLVRNDKKEAVPAQTLYEAAQFAACYSKAWNLGLSVIDVYCVRPNQLKKDNLPKGSFLVVGERIWFEKVKLRISIGAVIENNKVFIRAAPPVALRKQTQFIATLVPGNRSAKELAQEIKKHLISIIPFEFRDELEKKSLEEIERLIPYGKGELVKV
ncbi:MAG: ribosome rescue protein RqcH [Candidatus Aenigmatarchaeota archaeon]